MDIIERLDIIVPVYNSIEYTNRGFIQSNNYLKFYKEQRVRLAKEHLKKNKSEKTCLFSHKTSTFNKTIVFKTGWY